jgi:hypothetical protein
MGWGNRISAGDTYQDLILCQVLKVVHSRNRKGDLKERKRERERGRGEG